MMNTPSDRVQENKREPVANDFSQQKGEAIEGVFQFTDNRPEHSAQKKLQDLMNNSPKMNQLKAIQKKADNSNVSHFPPIQKKENNTGLPDNLKSGIENLSGQSMDDVKVHFNSDKPAQLNAHAYAQGTDIHLGAGQEKHLPHEAWHVVQQKQGRVQPTKQMKGLKINDNQGLEQEADGMGSKAVQLHQIENISLITQPISQDIIQGVFIRKAPVMPPPSPIFGASTASIVEFIDQESGYSYVFRKEENGLIYVERDDGFRVALKQTGDNEFEPIDANEDLKKYRLDKHYVPEPGDDAFDVDEEEEDEEMPHVLDHFEPSTRLEGRVSKKNKNSKAIVGPSLASNFTSQVAVSPLAQGGDSFAGQVYGPDQVLVESIQIGNQDRPDTRFGAAQKSHTVAWTLMRAALVARGGRPLIELLKYFHEEFQKLKSLSQSEEAGLLINMGNANLQSLQSAGAFQINRWQGIISRLVNIYIQAYQASSAATFSFGRAVGKGEADKMATLRTAEEELKTGKKISASPDDLVHAATGLLDAAFNRSLGAEGVAHAANHWAESLVGAFPHVMQAHGLDIIKATFGQAVSKGVAKKFNVSTWGELLSNFKLSGDPASYIPAELKESIDNSSSFGAVPDELDVDFVANAEVDTGPELGKGDVLVKGTSKTVSVSFYDAKGVLIERVHISDKDRPKTKFMTRQASHTAAWTLVRHDIMAFAGQSAEKVLHIMSRRLGRYIKDIRPGASLALAHETFIRVEFLLSFKGPIHIWQSSLSEVIRQYTIVSQQIESATHVDMSTLGDALGHAEAIHMRKLREVEYELQSEEKPSYGIEEIVAAAGTLLDVRIGGTLNAIQYVRAVFHWQELLHSAFPLIMANYGDEITSGVMNKKLSEKDAKAEKAGTVSELVEKYKDKAMESAVRKSEKNPGNPRAHLAELGFTVHNMPGTGNDCALNTIFDQLTRQGLDLGKIDDFVEFVRKHANLAFGTMVDILNNGRALLNAVNAYLYHIKVGIQDLVMDVWSMTADGGLMNFEDVATAGMGTRRVMTFLFNGVNHFDSLTGGLARH